MKGAYQVKKFLWNYLNGIIYNVRFYILVFSIVLSLLVIGVILAITPAENAQIVRLDQLFAFLSIIYLYLTLLAGPFCYTFRSFPYRKYYLKSRRALGVSSFYFALLHVAITFFGQLHGFSGLSFLSNTYLIALGIGFIALIILFLLAITSFDSVVRWLSFPRWKLLHRLVYIGGILIMIHALLLGTHFSSFSGIIFQITFFALAFLIFLEVPRIDGILVRKTNIALPRFSLSSLLFVILIIILYVAFISPISQANSNNFSFGIHAAHIQLAQQAQQNPLANANTNAIPGLNGDWTKRYTVSYNNPTNIQANQDTTLRFTIYDAETGSPVSLFRVLYAKQMHCIIVDSRLQYFHHIHPTQESSNSFAVTTQFPQDGVYHVYITFQPFGGIEQQVGFTQVVGSSTSAVGIPATQKVDSVTEKTFGDYTVDMDTHGTLQANLMSVGQQVISFSVKDAKTKKPITNLKPYLSAFGHLTMINEESYYFIHVHPYSLITPQPDANGGPTVDFLPIGIYGPFKPGVYRVFAEFNPDNKLFTADFTVRVE